VPVILALRRLRQKDIKFEGCLYYISRSCLKKTKQKATIQASNKTNISKSSKKIQEELYSMAKWDLFQE
jgi:hypothetical protein